VKLRWTDGAVEDLQSAHEYIAADNEKAAAETTDRIVSAVERLEQFPQMGRTGRVTGTRELVVTGTPFIAAYRLKRDSVQVLAVLHAARKWPRKF
jgi:toxin ParE1/3/4